MTYNKKNVVKEFYSFVDVVDLLDLKVESNGKWVYFDKSEMKSWCYQHKIETKDYSFKDGSNLFISGPSLQSYLSSIFMEQRMLTKWKDLQNTAFTSSGKRKINSITPEKPKNNFKILESHEDKYQIPEGFVDAAEAARILHLHYSTIMKRCHDGSLPYRKIISRATGQNQFIISKKDLESYKIKKQKIETFKLKEETPTINTPLIQKQEQKGNLDKSHSSELLRLKSVVDLNTLILIYPELKNFFAESRDDTVQNFIIDTIKTLSFLLKENPRSVMNGN
jgi:hypothetical protein